MSNENTKVVVITGCSSGIGLATAVLLSKEKNYKVIATMRNLAKKEALEKAAESTLNHSLFIKELDISKEGSITKFVNETLEEEGRIDVLINNAAINQFGKFEDVSLEQMQSIFQTNFFGTVRITQEVIRKMKERRSGTVIFVSSLVGVEPFCFYDFYVSSKFAIEGLVGSMIPLMRTFGIRVNILEPGPVKTELHTNISKNKQGSLEDKDYDMETRSLMKKNAERITAELMCAEQTSEEVAEVIKKCVEDDKSDVRVATSDLVKTRGESLLVDYSWNTIASKMEDALK